VTPSAGRARGGRSAALVRALLDVRRTAATASDALLNLVPDTGDHATGRVVDDFVEQASDVLRALVESLGDTVLGLEAPGSSAPGSSAPGSSAPGSSAPGSSAPESPAHDRSEHGGAPRGWGW